MGKENIIRNGGLKDMIINSLLQNDLYKWTMGQAVFEKFPDVKAKYAFKCRNDKEFTPIIKQRITNEVNWFRYNIGTELKETQYLESLPYIKKDYYVDFVNNMNVDHLREDKINWDEGSDELKFTFEGVWKRTILLEVPFLAIINEVYFRESEKNPFLIAEEIEVGKSKLKEKIDYIRGSLNDLKFVDFGTRRRRSRDWHEYVVSQFVKEIPNNIKGTSNVWLAKKYGLPPIGTMAHEWLMAGIALYDIKNAQREMLKRWLEVYPDYLKIALTDVFGIDAFLNDFDKELATAYEGVRHDSGDPLEWAEKMIKHYEKLNIDYKEKLFVFSDGLNVQSASKIYKEFNKRINLVFGIGTNFTNDLVQEPLQIVIKLIELNGKPVAKISDSAGKADDFYDEGIVKEIRKTLNIK